MPRGPARRDAELPFNAGPDARRSHVQGVRRFPAQMASTLSQRLRIYTAPSAEGGTARCRAGVLRADRPFIDGDGDRKSVVEGKSVSVRVDLGGRRLIKNKARLNQKDDQGHNMANNRNDTRIVKD